MKYALPGMDIDELHQQLEQRLLVLGSDEGTDLSLQHLVSVPPFACPGQSELLRYCEQLTGHGAGAVAFATEAPYLQELGMDVLVMGPGDIDQAHQPNEYLATRRLQPMTDYLSQLINHYCF